MKMRVSVVMMMVDVVVMMMAMMVMRGEASRVERQASKCSTRQPCTPLKNCQSFQALLRQPTPDTLRRITGALCNTDRRNVMVCCPGAISISNPTEPVGGESLLISRCGRPGSISSGIFSRRRRRQTRPPQFDNLGVLVKPGGGGGIRPVAGGVDVQLTQPFPWMAVLGYNSRIKPIWACGGSLITQQYVVTAAHCIHDDFVRGLTLEVIRLGELDLSTEPDCAGLGPRQVCAPPPQDFSPAQVIMHPQFNKRTRVSDDIALIRLDRKAILGPFVNPICLPAVGVGVKDIIGRRMVEVAGWGLNETMGLAAQHLQRARLPYFDKTQCNQIYNNTLVEEQVCFGGTDKDSCQGDSGGPIFIRVNFAANLVGLVSRGLDFRCATEGIPAVYTDIPAYRAWIINNLKP